MIGSELLEKCKKSHPSGEYEYLNIKLTENIKVKHFKLKLRCKSCNAEFEIIALNYYSNGFGKCKCKKNHINKKGMIDKLIAARISINAQIYDYSESNYTGFKKEIKIICHKHGWFKQRYTVHRSGASCPECRYNRNINNVPKSIKKLARTRPQKYTQEYALSLLKRTRDDSLTTYMYPNIGYTRRNEKINIICPIHGEFQQYFCAHLKGCGCPKCANISSSKQMTKSANDMVRDSKNIHGNKYMYDKSSYINSISKMRITCPLHGDFFQTPAHHISGVGCPGCVKYGFKINKKSILYYFKIKNTDIYKIGISNNSLKNRYGYRSDRDKIIPVAIKVFPGHEALRLEQRIIKEHTKIKFIGKSPLHGSGISEMFTSNILNMDIPNNSNELWNISPGEL